MTNPRTVQILDGRKKEKQEKFKRSLEGPKPREGKEAIQDY